MDAGKGCRQQNGKVRDTKGGASALLLAAPTPSNPKARAENPNQHQPATGRCHQADSGSLPQREDLG